jgi:hypothetical protein
MLLLLLLCAALYLFVTRAALPANGIPAVLGPEASCIHEHTSVACGTALNTFAVHSRG